MSKVQVVWFRDLVRWDIKSNVSLSLQSSHKQVLFEDLLSQAEVEYETLNPNKDYNILGVRSYGLGVYHNRTAKGNTLITKTTKRYQKIQEGNLFWCKVDTKNGAFGVTLTEHIGYYASHNMIQAKINTDKIDLLFLQHLFSCKFFQQFLDSQVTGTTNRQYISFKELLKIKIPLPPLKIQKQIVAKIESIKAQIKALQEEEKRLKDEIEAYIYIALGLEKKQEAKRQKVFIIRFKDLDRWDTRHNQSIAINLCHTDSIPYHTEQPNCHTEAIAEVSTNIESKRDFDTLSLRGEAEAFHNPQNNIKADFTESMDCHDFATQNLAMTGLDLKALLDSIPTPPPHGWEVKTLGEICEIINRNWHKYYKNETFPYIQISNVTQKGIDGYSLIHYDNAPSRAKTLVKTGELLISLTRPNLGAFAVVEQEYNNFVVSSGFAVVDSKNIVTNHYIKHILQSQIGIDIFNQIMSGALYPAISQGDLQNLKIPLPPLKVQEKIVAHIHKIESSIATTQEKAKALELELTHYIESTL
ncbi:hypothetical protein C826_00320 [Helicobacter bilis WiWa]|uniref:Type I restriction modification DNA specificity domain-containing protein n=2 Tax=Helicobacter bilis TaxID=37372 RepID=N2BRY1_9HELI|nr:restriction endonuclease subunit S [Helicobacter bilis]EMZ41303.1 hypothetical protein C826_00320 [Helicobacter bilis WiWa]TLE05825.1 restriction endonuclease subunit S [Helicobacter bilis]